MKYQEISKTLAQMLKLYIVQCNFLALQVVELNIQLLELQNKIEVTYQMNLPNSTITFTFHNKNNNKYETYTYTEKDLD